VITLDDVREAARRLDGVAHRTPALTSRTLDRLTGMSVFLKHEGLQRGGSFKFRGAYNAISSLSEEELARGVAAFSSGNHAQAIALAAGLTGTKAVILMPEDAPPEKVQATEGYGAEVVTYDRYREERSTLADELARERGMVLVPPYDDPRIMSGQGTTGAELVEDPGDLDILVVPVGGGGLIAGCATATKAVQPGLRVVGVEPEAGDDHRRSKQAGHRVEVPVPRTIADGLQVSVPGELTWEVNARLVDEFVVVTDAEIVRAMGFLFERMKIVVEPSGAVGVAALLEGRVDADGKRVGVILSGSNIGTERFRELMERQHGGSP
jgi:threo-3-hydroxy-L-aspartate ammonia-lyase